MNISIPHTYMFADSTCPQLHSSVTRNALTSWGILGESQVSNEGTHCNRDHDHAVVCHEKKPRVASQQMRLSQQGWKRTRT